MKIQVRKSTIDNIASKLMMEHANDGFCNNTVEPRVFEEMQFALSLKRCTNEYKPKQIQEGIKVEYDFSIVELEFIPED